MARVSIQDDIPLELNSKVGRKNEKLPIEKAAEEDNENIDEFDEILDVIGSHGKYQKILLYFVICPITSIIPFTSYNSLFMHSELKHWCYSEDTIGFNETELNKWKDIFLPKEIGSDGIETYSSCHIRTSNLNSSIIKCPNGWSYDRSELASTIDSDFNWVCDKSFYTTTFYTITGIGSLVGALVFGLLADKYGRKPIFFISLFIYAIFNIIRLFVPHNFILYIILSGISALGFVQVYVTPTMVTAELCDDEFRSWAYAFSAIVWVFGMALLPYAAYFLQNWFILGLVTTIPCLMIFGYIIIFPESPRWLISIGKIKEASVIIHKIAQTNNVEVDEEKLNIQLERLKKFSKETDQNIGIWTLFSKKNLAMISILLAISMAISIFIYDGITLNTPNIPGDQFFNFFLLAIIDIPSNWLGGYLIEKHGRRWIQVLFFGLSGLTCLIAAIFIMIPKWSIIVTIAILLSKFSITVTTLGVALQITELFPTPLRSTGTSFASMVTGIFALGTPGMVYLDYFFAPFPYIIMCSMALIAMIASMFLPETLHQHLPETVAAANNFGQNMKFWSLKPKQKVRKIKFESIRRR